MTRMLIVIAVVAGALGASAAPARASWAGGHCYENNALTSHIRRIDARAYAEVAIDEGYEWGGGCWNDDGVDDTPDQPDSSGEGADCSGFTFKVWYLRWTLGADGWRWYDKLEDRHGPYSTSAFASNTPDYPFFTLPDKNRSTTLYMDAFVKSGVHMGLLYTSVNPNANTDWIIEAKGDAAGMGLWERGYRYDAGYVAIRREGWTADCYPNCPAARPAPVVVA